jgi:hypothetical protein
LLLIVGLGACGDATAPDAQSAAVLFSQDITLPQLEETLVAGPTRLEIELLSNGSLVAREVEIKTADELAHREEIESPIGALEGGTDQGTIILELGGLRVNFDRSTRFRQEHGDDLTFDQFTAIIDDAFLNDRQLAVEAKRTPPLEPQAPDDATFFANELKLDDEADEPEIEINVDRDNLRTNTGSPPDGWILVLGLEIELRHSEGVTELESEMDGVDGETDFEGLVDMVDLIDSTVTLKDGRIIRIVTGTKIERDASDDDHLRSLQDVADAVASGFLVEADGEGVVETTDPLVIVAIEVEFEIENDVDDLPGGEEFEGRLASVNLNDETFTLSDGRIVQLDQNTQVDSNGDLFTLLAVSEALQGPDPPDPVRAEGHATVDDIGPPQKLTALIVKFEVDEPGT